MSEEDKSKRIEVLEELQRRIKTNSICDYEEATRILLNFVKNHGWSRPVIELASESLLLLLKKDAKYYQTILSGLEGQGKESTWLFLLFSKIIMQLDFNQKKAGVKPLLFFLMNNDAPGFTVNAGVNEVYDSLIRLGNEGLGTEIVNGASPFLNSLRFGQAFFSVKLCSKFGKKDLLPGMLKVLDKAEKGYFDGNAKDMEPEIFDFLGRIADFQGIDPLIKILKYKANSDLGYSDINAAMAKILNANPARIEELLEVLYDERRNVKGVSAILRSLAMMENPKVDLRKLLANMRIDWVGSHLTRDPIRELLIKGGKSSKPVLFEILLRKDPRKYSFGLECLKTIGISNDEIASIFPKPPLIELYNFFYKINRSLPETLNQLWREKEKLGKSMPGNTRLLEHLTLHLLIGFNFVTLNIAPLQIMGVDLVGFYPETLDLFLIGCTTGVIKDDLAKMDAIVKKMKTELPDIFEKCSLTTAVVCSENASVHSSDSEYANQNGINLLLADNIDTLLEMLNTNRTTKEVIRYIKKENAFRTFS